MVPGTVVGGRFAIACLAGRGGMGLVYRARDVCTAGEVAVKALGRSGGDFNERFAREADVLSRLAHPGIVRYVCHGATPAGDPYLVTEWLEGESLSERFERGALSLSQTTALGVRVAEALAAAHALGVVHRDLKPSNIHLPAGRPDLAKLLDFGISLQAGVPSLTMTGEMMGTPGFMAPEQARGERNVDARADLFALGCVLFKALAGRPAFREVTPFALLLEINTTDAPRLSTVVPSVPPALDALVAAMLARSAADRPDAAVVARELRRLAATIDDDDTVEAGTVRLESTPGSAPVRGTGTVVMVAVPPVRHATVRSLPPPPEATLVPVPEPIPPTVPWGGGRRRGFARYTLALLAAVLTAAVAVGSILASSAYDDPSATVARSSGSPGSQ